MKTYDNGKVRLIKIFILSLLGAWQRKEVRKITAKYVKRNWKGRISMGKT